VRDMGARRIFSRGGQIRGLGTKVLQRGRGMEPTCMSLGAEPQKPTTGCENNA